MNEYLKKYLKALRCVKKGRYHTLYYNPESKLYEIWNRFEQCEIGPDRTESIEIMKDLDRNYLKW